jgi:hypothetical protein
MRYLESEITQLATIQNAIAYRIGLGEVGPFELERRNGAFENSSRREADIILEWGQPIKSTGGASMPMQETFLDREVGMNRFAVTKIYNTFLAREVFEDMSPLALGHLSESLAIKEQYDPADIPRPEEDYLELLWDEMTESAREHGQRCSFFVVTHVSTQGELPLYVSGDWPSAEQYVERMSSQ